MSHSRGEPEDRRVLSDSRSLTQPDSKGSAPKVVRADGSRASLTGLPTSEMRLSPTFVEALKEVAPRPRRSVTKYVVGLAVAMSLVLLGTTPSVRGLIASEEAPGASSRPDDSSLASAAPAPSGTVEVEAPAVRRAADPAVPPVAPGPSASNEPGQASATPDASAPDAKAGAAKKPRRPRSPSH
jgi:hypothetical protein